MIQASDQPGNFNIIYKYAKYIIQLYRQINCILRRSLYLNIFLKSFNYRKPTELFNNFDFHKR